MNLIKYLIFIILLFNNIYGNDKKIVVQLNWKYQFEFAGFIAAKEKGYYKDVGLNNIEIKEFEANLDIIKNLKEGKITFGIYDLSLLDLEKEKNSLKLIANYLKRSALVLVTKQNIITPFDLKNKIIMTDEKQLEVSTLRSLFKKFKISKDDFIFKQHSFTAKDFIEGKVDALSAYLSNEIYDIQKSKIPFNIIDPQSYGIYGSGVNVFTSNKITFLEPKLVKNFIEATNKGWEYALKHKEEIVDIIYNKYTKRKTKESLLFEANQIENLMMPSIYKIGEIDKQLLQKNINEFISDGLLPKKFNIENIIYNINEKKENMAFTKEQKEYIKNRKPITMCIDPNWMPYEKLSKGKHIGITSEYIKLMSEKMGIPIKLIPTKSWSESVDFAKNRKCDIFSLASATPSRLKYMNFTTEYVSFPLVIATKTDELFISNPDEIVSKKKIAVAKDYAISEILKNIYPNNKIIDVENIDEGMQKVVSGEVFGFVDALPTIAYILQHRYIGELKISGKFNYNFDLGIGVRNDDLILFELFQKVIQSISEKKKQEILNKYISINVEAGFDYKLFYQIGLVLVIVAFFLFYRHLQLAKHNRILKKQKIEIDKSNKELIETKKKLEASIKDFEILFDSVTEAIFIFENNLCIDVNDTAIKMYGYDNKDEMIGKPLKDFIPKSEYEKILKKFDSNITIPKEAKGLKKNGTIIDVIAKGTNTILNSKKVRISALVDITETKQKEQLLFQQSKMAAMGQMLENIAHQWRQPLSLISSLSTALELKKELNISKLEDEKGELKKINNTAQHLSETIEDFRNFFKPDKKKVNFSVLKSVEKSLHLVEGVFKSKSIEVIFEDKEDINIKSYENEFTQALINILYNAKDALEKQKGLRVLFISLKKYDNFLNISIKDNAGGINEKIIKNIFEPYFTTKHQSQGTGIGLYMTQMIINKHMEGEIIVDNAIYSYKDVDYKGAQFTIKLPL